MTFYGHIASSRKGGCALLYFNQSNGAEIELMSNEQNSLFEEEGLKDGFTIVEVAVVMAVLSALGSYAIPNIINTVKLSRIEETKALMNSYAADCLGQYRISTDINEFNTKAPENLSQKKLNTLGYQLSPNGGKCKSLAITPLKKSDKDFLYEMQFRIYEDDETGSVKIFKGATPGNNPNPRSLSSCRGWAGENCGLSPEALAAIARNDRISKAKADCATAFQKKIADKHSGPVKTWRAPAKGNIKDEGACTEQGTCLLNGSEYRTCEAMEAARKRLYGEACEDWIKSVKSDPNYISPQGKGRTKKPECAGVQYWFHTGEVFETEADWKDKDEKVKLLKCEEDLKNKKSQQFTGEYVIQPKDGIKEPCGDKYYFCKGEALNSADYQNSSCVKKEEIGGGDKKDDDNQEERGGGSKYKEKAKGRDCKGKGTYVGRSGERCCTTRPRACDTVRGYAKRDTRCGCPAG